MTRRQKIVAWIVVGAIGLPGLCLGTAIVAFVWYGRTYPSPLGYQTYTGGPITEPGTYKLASGERLVINVDDKGIVGFEFFSEDGRKIARSDLNPSTYHRWAFVVDDQKWIWMYSGDLGTWVWTTYTTTDWKAKQVKGDAALEEKLPSGIKLH